MLLKFRNFVDYHQPDFYRFSQDSIEFVHWLEKQSVFNKASSFSCLDLCAGCGVIGLELLLRFPKLHMDFCEKQQSFKKFFEKNVEALLLENEFSVGQYAISDFRNYLQNPYDFIFCNPPYFSPSEGHLSSMPEKRICRFFSSKDWADLFIAFERLLKPEGQAFFLARKQQWDNSIYVQKVAELSGASIFCFDLNIERNK